MVDYTPYENVKGDHQSFALPRRKWRELVFIGAMRREGEYFVRDPARPMPPFRDAELFPEGVLFRLHEQEDGWIRLERVETS